MTQQFCEFPSLLYEDNILAAMDGGNLNSTASENRWIQAPMRDEKKLRQSRINK